MSCEVKSCVFARNNSIINTSNHCFLLLVKKLPHLKTIQKSSKQTCRWILMREDNSGWTFSLEEALWILARSNSLKLKLLVITNTHIFTSQDVNSYNRIMSINCGLLCCFFQLFGFSIWWHPITSEDSLSIKCCNAKFLQISSEKLIYVHLGWLKGEQIFIFEWTTPLKKVISPTPLVWWPLCVQLVNTVFPTWLEHTKHTHAHIPVSVSRTPSFRMFHFYI